MIAAPPVQLSSRSVEDARPTTFLKRGATVPFTTPVLLGSRVRPGARQNLEIALPSPAGMRGVYVLPLRSIRDICVPTLHDRLMLAAMDGLPALDPGTVLRLARGAAREGLAGRAAAAAAAAAEDAAPGQRTLTNYLLLMRLIGRLERPSEGRPPLAQDTPANVQARARGAVARLAGSLGTAPERIVAALDGLTEAFLDIGLPGNPTKARCQHQLAQLEPLSRDAALWAEGATDAQLAGSATLVARSAFFALGCGRVVLADVLACLDNLPTLVQRWINEPQAVLAETGKLAWLLDGWSIMASIWENAGRIGPSAAIQEMSVMVPSMPLEVDDWVSVGERELLADMHRRHSRQVSRLEEWRTGRHMELIQRNETIVRDFV